MQQVYSMSKSCHDYLKQFNLTQMGSGNVITNRLVLVPAIKQERTGEQNGIE